MYSAVQGVHASHMAIRGLPTLEALGSQNARCQLNRAQTSQLLRHIHTSSKAGSKALHASEQAMGS